MVGETGLGNVVGAECRDAECQGAAPQRNCPSVLCFVSITYHQASTLGDVLLSRQEVEPQGLHVKSFSSVGSSDEW